jgi:hypothetical protein
LIGAATKFWFGFDLPAAPPAAGGLIAHFPLSWHWNVADPRLGGCHQDIPAAAPALVAAMLAPAWPDRQWLARLLFRLRTRRSSEISLSGPNVFRTAPAQN